MPGAMLAVAVCTAIAHGLGLAVGDSRVAVVALTTFLGGSALTLAGLVRSHPFDEFGAANTVTLIRLALTSVLVGLLVGSPATPWAVPAVAALALALDGMDGWLARRSGLVSDFGGRFDMEVDCLLALTLALLVLDRGEVGVWVVALGLPRYVFWVASWVFPWLAAPLPERRSRKVVCVGQIIVLIALTAPPVDAPLAPLMAALALACVVWSFAVDVRQLHRARA